MQNSLASAFGKKFESNKDLLRTRTFELGGHTFKVKVPLTSELEAIYKRVNEPNDDLTDKYYRQLTDGLVERKENIEDSRIVFEENDVIVEGRSVREIASGKATTERRIVEMFKLLIAEEQGFDMDTITYPMIEELFPFAIQLEMLELIAKTISPEYAAERKK